MAVFPQSMCLANVTQYVKSRVTALHVGNPHKLHMILYRRHQRPSKEDRTEDAISDRKLKSTYELHLYTSCNNRASIAHDGTGASVIRSRKA